MNARAVPTEIETFERDVAPLRIPPHSIEAEMSLLGGLMLDNSLWDSVADIVSEADFYRYEHRLVFSAVASLLMANRTADVVTVFTQMQAQGKAEEAGGLAYLNSLAQFQPSMRSMRGYAETIRERALSRSLIAAADEIAAQAFNQTMPAAERIEQATSQLTKLLAGAPRDEWEDTSEGMVKLLDRIQVAADGTEPDFIPTGLGEIDDRLDGGMRGGELIVIGARPSMGKSAMGLTIAANVALDHGLPVGIFSMEMPKSQVNNRLMSLVSHIHLSRIKRPERLKDFDWPEITKGVETLRNVPISIADSTALNINQIRARTRALRRRKGRLGTIVVDYLGLMNGTDPKVPRAYQLEEVTKGLKSLAKELDMPVILLVQLNRKVEERIDQMPVLSDIRDAGSVEQDADIVIFIHRPIKAKPDMGDEWKYYAKISVAKVRDGEPGYCELMYVGENTRFMNWPDAQEKPKSMVRTKGKDL